MSVSSCWIWPRNVWPAADILSDKTDSSFGQQTPIIKHFGIEVTPLEHDYILPYRDETFDAVLSVGVLEHVANDRASLVEISPHTKNREACFFASAFFPLSYRGRRKLSTHGKGPLS